MPGSARPGGEGSSRCAGARARRWGDAAAAAAAALVAVAAAVLPAVVQDPAYHQFADRRILWHIPNAFDVVSNLAFTLAGALGLRAALRPEAFPDRRARDAWIVMFGAVVATSAGSAWYHLAPTSPRLFWDRLPMAIGFMALVAVLAGERFGAEVGRALLPRAILAGVAAVVWWALGDIAGRGNLLPYLAVQLGSLAAIPALLVGRRRAAGPRAPFVAALGLYVLAKLFEDHDRAVFAAAGVSGHTLKHLVAAAAIGVLAAEVSRRGRQRVGAIGGASAAGDGSGSRSSMLEKSFGA